jgi:hypothetical protein
VSWDPGPTLRTDGTIEHRGKAILRVNADGTMTSVEDGKAVPLQITADSVTIDPGDGAPRLTVALAADGKLTLPPRGDGVPVHDAHVAGADTPGKRRAVLAAMGAMFMIMTLESRAFRAHDRPED